MDNHIHFILCPIAEDGISVFMHKLATSYTKYFNNKNNRTGSLFESAFKARIIENDSDLINITRYVHLNPLETIEPEWKEKGAQNIEKAKYFLENYKWSSLGDHLGTGNFNFLLNSEFIFKAYFDGAHNKYKDFIFECLKSGTGEYGGYEM